MFPLALVAAAAGTASAQTSPITPGGVLDTLKRTPEVQPAEPLAPPPSGEAAARASVPQGAATKSITVEHFEFVGNTLYSGDELALLVADYTSRPITLVEL
jgi:hemolysin activation/secretion protein